MPIDLRTAHPMSTPAWSHPMSTPAGMKRQGEAYGEEPPRKILQVASWVTPAPHGAYRPGPARAAYNPGGSRFPPGFVPKKLCKFFDLGGCHQGDACSFAHGDAELHPETLASGGVGHAFDAAGVNPFEEADAAAAGDDDPDPLAALLLEQATAAGFHDASFGEEDIDAAFDAEMNAVFGSDQVPEGAITEDLVEQDMFVAQAESDPGNGQEEQEAQELVEEEYPVEPELCHSALIGPREFPPGIRQPQKLCQLWLQHPSLCQKGDACVDAHGLAEIAESGRSTAAKAAMASFSAPANVASSSRPPPAPRSAASPGPSVAIRQAARLGGGDGGGKGKQGFANQSGMGSVGPGGRVGKGAAMAAASATQYGRPPMFSPDGGGKGETGGKPSMPPEGGRFAAQGKGAGFMPTKVCTYWVKDPQSCNKGDQCSFAHGVSELRADAAAAASVSRFLHTGFRPTRICNFFMQGACHRGLQCTFAHSDEELTQQRP